MNAWSPDDLRTIGDAEELDISSLRPDGTLRPYVTIWHVAVGDELFVRSAYGPENGWFRRALASGAGRIRSGGSGRQQAGGVGRSPARIERDVTFDAPTGIDHESLDAAYREKYADQPPAYVAPVVGEVAAGATLRVSPR